MAAESFEVSQQDEYGDLLNRRTRNGPLKVGVYTSASFEHYRIYPGSLQGFVNADVAVIMVQVRRTLGQDAEIVWPGAVTTMDEADTTGRLSIDNRKHQEVLPGYAIRNTRGER